MFTGTRIALSFVMLTLLGCAGTATVSDTAEGPMIDDPMIVAATNRIENAKKLYLVISSELLELRRSGIISNDDLWARVKQADDAANIGLKEAMAALDAYQSHRNRETTTRIRGALVTMDRALARFRLHNDGGTP